MKRDSAATAEEKPVKCRKHDLYYNPQTGCFRCKAATYGPVTKEQLDRPPTPDGVAVALEAIDAEEDARLDTNELLKLPACVQWALLTLREIDAPSSEAILAECLELAVFLARKNKVYGDSALKPVRIISTAGPAEQIRIRIDDKLSRLVRGEAGGEDALTDLVGYYILLKVAEKNREEATP